MRVNVYDFPRLSKGPAIPYGAYDVGRNEGYINVGMNQETSEFAVESLRWWWRAYGRRKYPGAKRLLLCADGGGSNGSRRRAWKRHVQELATEMVLPITVCHYPPGTSKWNKIEHRLFSQISLNWQGIPLESCEAVVSLIAETKNGKGLRVRARPDRREYAPKEKVISEVMSTLKIRPHATNPQWNYTIDPVRNRQMTLPATAMG